MKWYCHTEWITDILYSVTQVSMHDESFSVEPLLLCINRSQLRWFRHLLWLPSGWLPLEVFRAQPIGRRPWSRPRTHWPERNRRILHYFMQNSLNYQKNLSHVQEKKCSQYITIYIWLLGITLLFCIQSQWIDNEDVAQRDIETV